MRKKDARTQDPGHSGPLASWDVVHCCLLALPGIIDGQESQE